MATEPERSVSAVPTRISRLAVYLVPVLFVWLRSTGFIDAKYGLPYAEPFTLLLYRMLSTLVLLGVLAWFAG